MVAAAAAALAAGPALAHHAMGGKTPSTLVQGLLSGLGHPIIGIDHLAFIVAVGLVSGLVGSALLLPALFIAGTIGGCAWHVLGLGLPFSEILIAASLIAAAVIVAARLRLPTAALALLFAASGLVHGYAYGESIVGAEPTPLAAYIAGFGIVQLAVAVAAAQIMRILAESSRVSEVAAFRVAGALIALVAAISLTTSLVGA
jgi:urease accessory protein